MVSIRALPLAAIFLALAVVHGTNSLAAGPTDQDNRPPPQSVEALAAGIEHEDPAALELSNRLWGAGRKDDAVFFFYLGQLRSASIPRVSVVGSQTRPLVIRCDDVGDGAADQSIRVRRHQSSDSHDRPGHCLGRRYATREGREAAKAGLKKMRRIIAVISSRCPIPNFASDSGTR
jgi:hypothetical protein